MKQLAIKDLFRDYYNLEPSVSQNYQVLITLPYLFKILFGIWVDARIIPSRKWYLVTFGILQALCMLTISIYHFKSVLWVAVLCSIKTGSAVFLDTVVESYVV